MPKNQNKKTQNNEKDEDDEKSTEITHFFDINAYFNRYPIDIIINEDGKLNDNDKKEQFIIKALPDMPYEAMNHGWLFWCMRVLSFCCQL